ncbi:unnamed protein product [Porites lobata]|uniref:ALOG domain-containing protein n=1 Tax=Porites lobata TaxID=104759 RepID=A0ABN8RSM9_9CNID|nr:unnamed protein product [Porites lobata]
MERKKNKIIFPYWIKPYYGICALFVVSAPRFTEFQESLRNKPYERQKDSLEVQLSSFLRPLVPPKKFSAAIAEDIVKFLISMDAAGKQKLHIRSCSSKTCTSHIGKLRSIFNRLGRRGFSNPFARPRVKEYIMFAVALFYDKIHPFNCLSSRACCRRLCAFSSQ